MLSPLYYLDRKYVALEFEFGLDVIIRTHIESAQPKKDQDHRKGLL